MTDYEDSPEAESTQAKTLRLSLPGDLWLSWPASQTNRRGLMIFLRSLCCADGRPYMTFSQIAQVLGYPDRRNVHNYWMEFCACEQDVLAFLTRRKKVDAEVTTWCETVWRAHPLWSVKQVHAEVVRLLGKRDDALSERNIRTAGEQVSFLSVRQALCRQVKEGKAHYSEEALLSSVKDWVEQTPALGSAAPIPETLETALLAPSPGASSAELETSPGRLEEVLLTGDACPEVLEKRWQGRIGQVLLCFILYYHGISLSVLGGWFGVHKTTVMRWLIPLSQVNWQKVVQAGVSYCSGVVAMDEKWIKIDGAWHYLFAAVDHVSFMPLHVALFPSNSGAYCQLFLWQFKQLGYSPRVIITDGWDAYKKAIANVYPCAEHLLCRFHAIKAAYRHLRGVISDGYKIKVWGKKICHLFHTSDKRTTKRRFARLSKAAETSGLAPVLDRLAEKLPQLLPAVGSTFRPTTSNAVEQFFSAFDRFYRSKGPFQHKASAEKHVALFLIGYVFSVRSKEAIEAHQGRCVLQQAGYNVSHLPIFHLFNRPQLKRLQDRIAETFAPAA